MSSQKTLTKVALLANAALDMLPVFSPRQRQKRVGKVFGAGTAVGHVFFAHALIRGAAGFNIENIQLRRAAFYSLLIEFYYCVASGKTFKTMRPLLVVIGLMLTVVGSSLKKNFTTKRPKIKQHQ